MKEVSGNRKPETRSRATSACSVSCGLCRLISGAEQSLQDELNKKKRFEVRVESVKARGSWLRPGLTSLEVGAWRIRGGGSFLQPEGDMFLRQIMLWADPSAPAARDGKVYSGPRITNSGSSEALQLVKTWHDACFSSHMECRKAYSGEEVDESVGPPLPTRLLRVLPDLDQMQLVEASGLHGRYAALSYCWGSPDQPPPPTTTSANLADRLAGISTEELPKTFKDAVALVRVLGIPYLWIDSLCILQDSKTDWERQAVEMGIYYARAQLVIGAAASDHPDGGIFQPYVNPSTVELPYFNASGHPDGLVHAHLAPSVLKRSPYGSVLATRGWTFQEDILARRMVFFTDNSIIWRCSEVSCDELQRFDPNSTMDISGRGFDHPDGSDSFWAWLIVNYSRRTLTYLGDKLAALQGIFEQHGRRTGAAVRYGLRSERLLRDLAWRPWFGHDVKRTPTRPELSRFPSWSWLSVDYAISYRYDVEERDVTAIRLSDDPSELALDGPHGPVRLKYVQWDNVFDVITAAGEILGRAELSVPQGGRTSCLLTRVLTRRAIEALIVVPVDGQPERYQRIGVAWINHPTWAAALSPGRMVLI